MTVIVTTAATTVTVTVVMTMYNNKDGNCEEYDEASVVVSFVIICFYHILYQPKITSNWQQNCTNILGSFFFRL